MNLKYNIGKKRNQLGVSQEWLAEKMSVSRQTISKWENGDAMPSTRHLLELEELFDCELKDLVKEQNSARYQNGIFWIPGLAILGIFNENNCFKKETL